MCISEVQMFMVVVGAYAGTDPVELRCERRSLEGAD